MPMLLNAAGRPEPSPEVVRRLKAIDPRLKVQWVAGIGGNWAVTCDWAENDRRWEWVQQGRTGRDRAYDVFGYIPFDCPLDEAPALIERMFRQYPRDDARKMAESVLRWNEESAGQAEVEQAVAEVLDMPDPTQAPKKRGRPKKER